MYRCRTRIWIQRNFDRRNQAVSHGERKGYWVKLITFVHSGDYTQNGCRLESSEVTRDLRERRNLVMCPLEGNVSEQKCLISCKKTAQVSSVRAIRALYNTSIARVQ